jgi:hypothetical protein
MSSIGGHQGYPVPWMGYEGKVLMLIRITRLHKWLSQHKEIGGTGFTAPSVRYSEAFYMDRKQAGRMLCGSI